MYFFYLKVQRIRVCQFYQGKKDGDHQNRNISHLGQLFVASESSTWFGATLRCGWSLTPRWSEIYRP
ncbi:hypothetical protein V6N13_018705 [Hibiscus sabdariffa]|uniref:Uncharacterized protein n=1 Tax=Hibiscus sabdariffa TaxID=183260 RepID=A0ABR2EMT6_9ROSI